MRVETTLKRDQHRTEFDWKTALPSSTIPLTLKQWIHLGHVYDHPTTVNKEIWGKSNLCIPFTDIFFRSPDCVKTDQSCCCDFSKEASILGRSDQEGLPPPDSTAATVGPYLYCLIVRTSRGSTGNPDRERHRYPSKASWRNRCCSRTSVVSGSLAIWAEVNSLQTSGWSLRRTKFAGCEVYPFYGWNVITPTFGGGQGDPVLCCELEFSWITLT